MGSTLFGNDYLEIFTGDDQRAIRGNVEFIEQSIEISLQRLACRGIKLEVPAHRVRV